jgi:hypothetical protein
MTLCANPRLQLGQVLHANTASRHPVRLFRNKLRYSALLSFARYDEMVGAKMRYYLASCLHMGFGNVWPPITNPAPLKLPLALILMPCSHAYLPASADAASSPAHGRHPERLPAHGHHSAVCPTGHG